MAEEIVLYSTGCPKCKILKSKLLNKGISYIEINDVGVMIESGFLEAPVLEVDSRKMNFLEANAWINEKVVI
jgi:hypothetical protein